MVYVIRSSSINSKVKEGSIQLCKVCCWQGNKGFSKFSSTSCIILWVSRLKNLLPAAVSTVFLILLHTPRFLLEIRVIIKIYPILGITWIVTELIRNEAFFFWKIKLKMTDSKNLRFSTPPILNIFSCKCQRLVLGQVG